MRGDSNRPNRPEPRCPTFTPLATNLAVSLSGKQRRYLRSLAHTLDPVVVIGQRGLSDAVARQVEECLAAHELIKVKLTGECPVGRRDAAVALAERTHSHVAGEIGHVIILYRAHPERPTIQLPGN